MALKLEKSGLMSVPGNLDGFGGRSGLRFLGMGIPSGVCGSRDIWRGKEGNEWNDQSRFGLVKELSGVIVLMLFLIKGEFVHSCDNHFSQKGM